MGDEILDVVLAEGDLVAVDKQEPVAEVVSEQTNLVTEPVLADVAETVSVVVTPEVLLELFEPDPKPEEIAIVKTHAKFLADPMIKPILGTVDPELGVTVTLPPVNVSVDSPPSDVEVQAEIDVVAPGAYFRNRCSVTPEVTDTFVVGGVFAPGRQRWVQTKVFDSARAQAEAIRDALI